MALEDDDIVSRDTQPLEADEPRQNDIEVEQVREVEAREEQPFDIQYVVPDWLRDRMRRSPSEEIDPAVEMEELLNRVNAPPTKKRARKFSKISTDEDGSCTLHMAVPRVDCDRDEAVPENYVITTMELGCPTGAQIVEECDNSYQALKDRLFKKEGKYKKLKREHKALIGYVQ